jgi:competence protein ComEC
VNDLWAVGLALAVTAGAWSRLAVSPWIGAAAGLVGLAVRRPLLVCVGAALAAAGLSAQAWAGATLDHSSTIDGVVTLVTDPQRVAGAVRVVVEVDGHRLEVWGRGATGRQLARRLAGERIAVTGRASPASASTRRRLAAQHVAGRLDIVSVTDWWPGDPLHRSANRVRRALVDGAASMTSWERSLFSGFVVGDDRDEPPALVEDFRAAGLSHLTAVSGENLAFILVLARPLLRRLRTWPRAGLTVAVIGWFALLTRFEPSVLRAAAMAALAALAVALGRPQSTLRLVALAVSGILLVDPLLVWSVGWWLSVGATAGIALLAGPLTTRLPGPRWLATALAVTVGAQVGVAPVSLAVFGTLPLVSLVANPLAVPVAGLVMVWGLPAGLVAGLLPPGPAAIVHLPTRVGIRWIALVARVAAAAPVASLRPVGAVVLGLAVLLTGGGVALVRRRAGRSRPPPAPWR